MYISDFYGKCREIYHTWMLWDKKGCCLVEFASIQGPFFTFSRWDCHKSMCINIYIYNIIYYIYICYIFYMGQTSMFPSSSPPPAVVVVGGSPGTSSAGTRTTT